MPGSAACVSVRRRRARRCRGRTMTVALKRSDSVVVEVALPDRAYDIVIGRDVLPSLGMRLAALRPGARTAIVTDRSVARHWLEKAEAALAQAGVATSRVIVEEGES